MKRCLIVVVFVLSEKGQVYKQKKPTMYPPWSTTFDAHIHRGRIMHVMVKDRTAELKSETTVALDSLATQCKKENGKLEIWVSAVGVCVCVCVCVCVWVGVCVMVLSDQLFGCFSKKSRWAGLLLGQNIKFLKW